MAHGAWMRSGAEELASMRGTLYKRRNRFDRLPRTSSAITGMCDFQISAHRLSSLAHPAYGIYRKFTEPCRNGHGRLSHYPRRPLLISPVRTSY